MSQKSYNNTATLYLIPTPIGNLDDITLRAVKILNEVEVIFCEDTRITSLLLKHLNIKKKLISNHKFNESNNENKIIEYLSKGFNVGLVTDRGTPIISDPGFELVKIAIDNNYNVVALPGPTAFVPALICSGINPQPFLFYGFLNNKESKLKKELEELKSVKETLIFYESPHRINRTLNDMLDVLGNRKISISREISKKFEEIYRGMINEIIPEMIDIKGEMVIVVSGNDEIKTFEHLSIIEHVNLYLKEGMTSMDAIKKVSSDRNINKNEVYKEYHRGE
ncbi:MAG: 16S rRNA (cytidine(1402)-2'-O)-methyltransferase [Bacilli bacterium]|nr:16S rRNA (cytidine(1402)-2'-O)-methyltransferase [Bacilli bacterium]